MKHSALKHIGTRPIETARLLLRRQEPGDVEDMFRHIFSDAEVARFMRWKSYASVDALREDVLEVIASYASEKTYRWAIVLKGEERVIGSISAWPGNAFDQCCDLGYCLARTHWGNGYMSEAVRAVTHYMLYDVGMNRVEAFHAVQNPASGAVLLKAGMRHEGTARQKFRCNVAENEGFADAELYGVVKDELFYPRPFERFYELEPASESEHSEDRLSLYCLRQRPAQPEIGHVPDYLFEMRIGEEKVGNISLRIGMVDSLYYGGHIGYDVQEAHRGKGYAGRACRLLLPLIRAHGYKQILISNNHTNLASRRVCEKLGAELIRIAELPDWHDLYAAGQRLECVWVWNVAD